MNRRTFGLQIIGGFVVFRQQKESKPKSYTRAEVAARVKQVVVQQLGVEERDVVDKARFIEDLRADSLDIVELVLAFEGAFEIQIPDEDCKAMKTVGNATTTIERRLLTDHRLS